MIRDNLIDINRNIKAALDSSNRSDNVRLIAVSKTKPVSMIKEAYELGCRDFGENRVQELVEKYDVLPSDINWHMIGHLQKNKVKYIIDKVKYIHSVDSYELAKEINRQAELKNVDKINILIEVNVANEDSKFGVKIDDLEQLVKDIVVFPHLQICGLMTVAPYVVNENENSKYFLNLGQLIVDILSKYIDNINVYELSMGMSNDYKVAISCGATMIRIGSNLFGDR